MSDDTRNTILEAELTAELKARRQRREDFARTHPEAAKHVAEAERLIAGGDKSDEELDALSAASWMKWASYCCHGTACDHHVFTEGDVIHRRRRWDYDNPWGASWAYESWCEACVSKWHPSWLAHRREPVPCKGGCGALVSQWGWGDTIYVCSRRCSEIVQRERRRVKHDPRTCEVCEQEFVPRRSDARFCSNACRQDAYRKRKLTLPPR